MNNDERLARRKAYYVANRERHLAAAAAWGKANPEKRKAIRDRYYAAHKDELKERKKRQSKAQNRAGQLSRYGLTPQSYDRMAAAQDHACLICGAESWTERHGWLCIDHDHATGTVRGLLCTRCNTGLGQFQDSLSILKNAVAYLSRTTPD